MKGAAAPTDTDQVVASCPVTQRNFPDWIPRASQFNLVLPAAHNRKLIICLHILQGEKLSQANE
ncbi:Hypothetical predicted protein, partial [Olea europaea subsp. europaea]